MIIYFLLQLFIKIGEVLTSVFGSVTVLPYGIDEVMVTLFGWLRYLISVVWPIQVIFDVVLIYLGFKVSMILLKVIMGNRSPSLH